MTVKETAGDRLTQAMKRAGVSNGAIADAAKVHVTTISRWRHDVNQPEDQELDRVVAFLKAKGVDVTPAWLRYGDNGQPAAVRERAEAYSPMPAPISQIVFDSATAQQRAKVWLEGFLLELAEEGATQEFLDSSRRLLLNSQNYAFAVGAAAGHRDTMNDDEKLQHMQALAVGIRAALKARQKKPRIR